MSEFLSPMRSSQIRQLIEFVIHEVRLIHRQRVVLVLLGLIGIFMAILTVTDNPVIFPPPQYRSPLAMFLNPMNMLHGMLLMTVIWALPLLLADRLPAEQKSGIGELTQAYLPGTTVYLAGKMLGAVIAVVMVLLIVAAIETVLLLLMLGSLHAQFFFELTVWSLVPAAVYATCLSVLLSAPFRSRVGGLVAGLAIIGLTLLTIQQSNTGSPVSWVANLTPANSFAFRHLVVKWGEPIGVRKDIWGIVSFEQMIIPLLISAVAIVILFVVINYLLSRREMKS